LKNILHRIKLLPPKLNFLYSNPAPKNKYTTTHPNGKEEKEFKEKRKI